MSSREEPFARADEVVWRSLPGGDLGYVFACRVLIDEPDVIAVVQPTGSVVSRRSGTRGGRNGRSLLPGGWDGGRVAGTWDRLPSVRLHPIGRHYSVIRTWLAEAERCDGWYVNLERPWTRTSVGFDSEDLVLDVTATRDLSDWQLKDEDELAFAVEVGLVSEVAARRTHAIARAAAEDLDHRRWPFDEAAWPTGMPPELLAPVTLPDRWDGT